MWLVKVPEPSWIVELGTHTGFSYFAMCRSVKETGLDTDCDAVDTWAGDQHAGFYSDEVYDGVRAENRKYDDFSTLLRKTFEEALDDIENGSVDLLHVDGRHFYDDVKYDFESWVPKLSSRAVVLCHDTMARERGFGVYKYWAEISKECPSFNFTHCHGHGVLFRGQDVPQMLRDLGTDPRSGDGANDIEAFFATEGHEVFVQNYSPSREELACAGK